MFVSFLFVLKTELEVVFMKAKVDPNQKSCIIDIYGFWRTGSPKAKEKKKK